MRSIVSTKYGIDSGVLVLGAMGRLGAMLRQHWPVPGQLRGQSRRSVVGQQGLVQLDPINDPDALRAASKGVSTVICMSGVTPSHAAATGDAMSLNTDLALAALAAAPKGARVFVISSAAVYGAADGPHQEGCDVQPVSAYGHAKRAMERAALRRGAGRVCVLRIGNVAGADAILGGWHAGMALDQMPDGRTPRRSYIGPQTLARVLHKLCFADDVPEILNIAAPSVIEMGKLLDAAALGWTPRTAGEAVIPEVALDTTALEHLYDFGADEGTAQGMVAQWRMGADLI